MVDLTQNDLKRFEEKLLDLQEQIMGIAELVGESAQTVELDQNRVGRLSRIDAMQGQAMAQASAERQAQKLRFIEQALARIDDNVFGLCLECDSSIKTARLEADPTVEHCIDCASRMER